MRARKYDGSAVSKGTSDTDEATELRAWLLESFVQLASAYRRAAGSARPLVGEDAGQ